MGRPVLVALAMLTLLTGCVAVPASPLDNAARAQLAAQLVNTQWQRVVQNYPDAVRPVLPGTRVIPDHDWALSVVDCLRKLGYISYVFNDSYQYDPYNGESAAQFRIDGYSCTATHLQLSKVLAELTPGQVNAFDDFEVTQVVPCLRAAGARTFLPPVGHLTGIASWSPFDYVWLTDSEEEAAFLEQRCPPIPYWLDFDAR